MNLVCDSREKKMCFISFYEIYCCKRYSIDFMIAFTELQCQLSNISMILSLLKYSTSLPNHDNSVNSSVPFYQIFLIDANYNHFKSLLLKNF